MNRKDYEQYFLQHLPKLQELIRIPSVYDEDTVTAEMPYGFNVNRALMYMNSVLEEDGFRIFNYDNKVIFAGIGRGSRIDVLCHLDVVGVRGQWDRDPFSGDFDGEYLHGRGTQDMKVPGWLMYLAFKMIRDSGKKLNKEIRLVYGGDEERMMSDMKFYRSVTDPAAFSLTPDSRFPVVTGEKGVLCWDLTAEYDGNVIRLDCGTSGNAVPVLAECEIRTHDSEELRKYLSKSGIKGDVRETADGLLIRVYGVSAHASHPEQGHNALTDLLKILKDVYDEPVFGELHDSFHDCYGSGCEISCERKPLGRLTVNPGLLKLDGNKLLMRVDCRYPAGVTSAELTEKVRKHVPSFEVEMIYDAPATLVPDDDPYVQVLLHAYRKVTGRDDRPLVSDSGSYAKVVPHCVGMGPLFPQEEGLLHGVNERMSLDRCVDCLMIYHEALLELLDM